MTAPDDREPFEVALDAIADLAAALSEVAEEFEVMERQLRNARMTDALELSPAELAAAYPEAVDEDGFLRAEDDEAPATRPAEEPYEFWTLTADAAIATRLAGALGVAADLVQKLGETQPPRA